MVDLIPSVQAIVIDHVLTDSVRPYVNSYVYDRRINWLADTGSGLTCLDESLLQGLPLDSAVPVPASLEPISASGHDLKILSCSVLPITINNITYSHPVYVIRGLASKAILGNDFLKQNHAIIDTAQNLVQFPEKSVLHNVQVSKEITIPPHSLAPISLKTPQAGLGYVYSEVFAIEPALVENVSASFTVPIHNPTDHPLTFTRNFPIADFHPVHENELCSVDSYFTQKTSSSSSLTPEKRAYIDKTLQTDLHDRQAVLNLLYEFHDVISDSKSDLGYSDALPLKLEVTDETPVHLKQFRVPDEYLPFLHEYVQNLKDSGCIQLSNSAWNTPVFIVKKPHNSGLRLVQDLRPINNVLIPNSYCIPEIRDAIDDIGRKKGQVFSKIDLTSAYWQQQLHPDSRKYTAFTIPNQGRYEWCTVPQGISSAPSGYQRFMDLVMRDLPHTQCFIDDILCQSPDKLSHFRHLTLTLQRLRKFHLKLNLLKSSFFAEKIDYLGHVVSKEGISPSLEKTKAMENYPVPTTVKKIRQFTGLANYFRDYIPNFSILAGHLTALTRKGSKWKSGPLPFSALNAFHKLRTALSTKPVLAYPLPDTPYLLTVDAATGDDSNPGGLSAVLTQIDPQGKERVISYASRSLKDHEKNYSAFLLEMTACLFGIERYSVYLAGSRPFTLLCDHRPIEKVSKLHQKTMNRLQQKMLEFNFVVAYRKGSLNQVADALSRNPVDAISSSSTTATSAPPLLPYSAATNSPPQDLFKAQQLDPECKALFNFLKFGKLPKSPSLQKFVKTFSQMASLHANIIKVNTKVFSEIKSLFLVPKAWRFPLLFEAHAGRFSGHLGIFKTLHKLLGNFFWPGMSQDAKNVINTCQVCARISKPHSKTLKQPLTSLPISTVPNFRVHADLIGQLQSSSENKWILVITDSFSKYAVTVPLRSKDSKEVAQAFFNHWILKFSSPKILITDRGSEFNNKLFKELNSLLGTEYYKTSSYHAQTNSNCERFNRTLERIITSLLLQHQKSSIHWEQILQLGTFSYNVTVHKNLNYSPFYLTYLRPPNIPFFDFNIDQPEIVSWPEDVLHSLTKIYDDVTKALNASLPTPTGTFRKFSVGDRVLVSFPKQLFAQKETPKGNPKFNPNYKDNYTIVRKISDSAFHVKRPYGQPIVVNADRLKFDTSPPPLLLLLGESLAQWLRSTKFNPEKINMHLQFII